MSMALFFLIAAVFCAAVTAILYAAMENDPAPSLSGYIVPVVIFAIAAPCLLLLAVLTWVVSVTMAVL